MSNKAAKFTSTKWPALKVIHLFAATDMFEGYCNTEVGWKPHPIKILSGKRSERKIIRSTPAVYDLHTVTKQKAEAVKMGRTIFFTLSTVKYILLALYSVWRQFVTCDKDAYLARTQLKYDFQDIISQQAAYFHK